MLVDLYRMMVFARVFDKKAIALQRTGNIGTYPSLLGQEALSVGVGVAMRPEDIFCPYYRDQGALFCRGLTVEESLLYWGGDERGADFKRNKQDYPPCVPVASQTLHAVGAATAIKIKGEDKVVVTTLGDGGTSRGDFYEAMNIAGVWKLPVVFVINNNQWAISVPRSEQTAAKTLSQKAVAAGLEGIQIDGNDVLIVKKTIENAIQKARLEQKATVIEGLTYRMGDHTTADDASRYRTEEEFSYYAQLDPISRAKQHLMEEGTWTQKDEDELISDCEAKVNEGVERFLNMPPQNPESIFDYVYATLPALYQDERNEVMKK